MLSSPLMLPQLAFPAGETSGRQTEALIVSRHSTSVRWCHGEEKEKWYQCAVSQQVKHHRTDPLGLLLRQQYTTRPVGHQLSAQCPLKSPTCVPGSDIHTNKKESPTNQQMVEKPLETSMSNH